MKECPQCKRTYADESLTFCLDDGALLSAPFDPHATLVLNYPSTLPVAKNKKPNAIYFVIVIIALVVGSFLAVVFILGRANLNKNGIGNNSPSSVGNSNPSLVNKPDKASPSPTTAVDFSSVSRVSINSKFPSAGAIHETLRSWGYPEAKLDLFGDEYPVPPVWTIKIGADIDVKTSQAIIKACLNQTEAVWTVLLMEDDAGSIGNRKRVYIGGLDVTDSIPKMSKEQQTELLNPTLTQSEFHNLLYKKPS